MIVDQPMEMLFAEPTFMKWRDKTYQLNSNHMKSREYGTEEYPYAGTNLQGLLWDKDLPDDDPELEWRVMERFWEENEDWWTEENCGVNITTDLRGYGMIALVPLNKLENEREELEADIEACEDKICDECDDNIARIKEIDEELLECVPKLDRFEEIVESMKGYFDEHVVVVDENGKYDFVDKEWYEDMKEENRWKLWKP